MRRMFCLLCKRYHLAGEYSCEGDFSGQLPPQPAPSAEPVLNPDWREVTVKVTWEGSWIALTLGDLAEQLSRYGLAIVKASGDTWQDKHARLAEQMRKLAETVASLPCAGCKAKDEAICAALAELERFNASGGTLAGAFHALRAARKGGGA